MTEPTGRSEIERGHGHASERATYQPPTVEVICLDCEISSYAPDGGDVPLF